MAIKGFIYNISILFRKVPEKITKIDPKKYIFWTTIIFYFAIWFINPNNKLIVGSFLFLIPLFYFRIKDLRISLLLAYIVSTVIFVGKTYIFQLIPPGVFSSFLYPKGVVVSYIVSPKHILVFLMSFVVIKDLFKYKHNIIRLNKVDIILICYYVWLLISDVFGSKKPQVSLLFSLISVEYLILYIYIRIYSKIYPKLLQIVLYVLYAIIVFESIVSFQQFAGSSPVFKNIEDQFDIVYFGSAPDESRLTYRPLGTFAHANIMGAWLSFLLPLTFVHLFGKKNHSLLIVYIFGLITLIMTLGRSSWMGCFLGTMVILYVNEKINKIKPPTMIVKHYISLGILTVFLLTFFVLPRANKSLYSFLDGEGGGYLRLAQTQETIKLIGQNPIFGVGSAMTIQESININPRGISSATPISVHNWYLLVAAEHGLPALVLFLIFMIVSIRMLAINALSTKIPRYDQRLSLGVLTGIIALLISGLFQNVFIIGLISLFAGLFVDKNVKIYSK